MGLSGISKYAIDQVKFREGYNFSTNPNVDKVVAGTREALKDILEMEKFDRIEDVLPMSNSNKCELYKFNAKGNFLREKKKIAILGKNVDFNDKSIQKKYKRFADRFEILKLHPQGSNPDEYKKLEKLLAMRLFFDYCGDKKIVIDQRKINLNWYEKDFTGVIMKDLREASFKDDAGNLYDQKTPVYKLNLVGVHETRTDPTTAGPTYVIYTRADFIQKLEREKNKLLKQQEGIFQNEWKNNMRNKAIVSSSINFANRDIVASKIETILDWTNGIIKESDSIELRTGINPKSVKFQDLPDEVKDYFRNEYRLILSIPDVALQAKRKQEFATQMAEVFILYAGLEIQVNNDRIWEDNRKYKTNKENKTDTDQCLYGLKKLKSSQGRTTIDFLDVETIEYPLMRIVSKIDEEIFSLEEEKKRDPGVFNNTGKQSILDAKIKQRNAFFDMREKKKQLDAIIADTTKTPQEIQFARNERKKLLEDVYKPAIETEREYWESLYNIPQGTPGAPNKTEKEIIKQKIEDIEKHLKHVEDAIQNPNNEAKNGNTKIPKKPGGKQFYNELMSVKFFDVYHVVRKKSSSTLGINLDIDSIENGLTIMGTTIDIHGGGLEGHEKTETILGQYVQEAVEEKSRQEKENILRTKKLIPRIIKLLRYNFTDKRNGDNKTIKTIEKFISQNKDQIIKDTDDLQERGVGVARMAREGSEMIGNGKNEGFEKVKDVSGDILDQLAEKYANNPNSTTLDAIKRIINDYYKNSTPPFDEIKQAYGISGRSDNDAVLDILEQIKEQAVSKKAFADLLNQIEAGNGRDGLINYINAYGIPSFILGFARTKTGNPNLSANDIQEGIKFVNSLGSNEIDQIKIAIQNATTLNTLRNTTTKKFGPKIKISVYKHKNIGPVGGISMENHFGKTFSKRELVWRGGVTAAGIAIKALLGASCPLFWVAAGVGMAHIGIGLFKKNYEIGKEFKDLYNKTASGLVIDENYIKTLKEERDKVSLFWKIVGITMGRGKRASLNDRVQIAKYVRGKLGENQIALSDMIKNYSDTAKYQKIDISSRIAELKNQNNYRNNILIYDTLARFEAQVILKKDFFSSAINETTTIQRAELVKELRNCILRQLDPTNTNRFVFMDNNGKDINASQKELQIMKNPTNPNYQATWKSFIERIKSNQNYMEFLNALIEGDKKFINTYKTKKIVNLGVDATRGMVKLGAMLALGKLVNKGREQITSKTEYTPGTHIEHYKQNPLIDNNAIGEADIGQDVINDLHSKLTGIPDNSTIKFKIGTSVDRRWASTNGKFSDTITNASINDTIDFVKNNTGHNGTFDQKWADGFEQSYRQLMEQVKTEAIQKGVKEGNINLAQLRVNAIYRKILEECVNSGGKSLKVESEFDPLLCNFQESHHSNPGISDYLADQARKIRISNLTISKPEEVHHIPGVKTEIGHAIPVSISSLDSSSFRGSPNNPINPNANNPNNPNVAQKIKQ